MGKNKLKKFSEMETFGCVMQYPRQRIIDEGFPYKSEWNRRVFPCSNNIVVELGCGKGEYTVGLGRKHPHKNFVGIDIKGARMWTGAREVEMDKLSNIKFLRTEIENIDSIFGNDEISEIWITFPDPQMQKRGKRLTSSRFLEMYSRILSTEGVIHLKTDSPFLFEYTKRILKINDLEVIRLTGDLYGEGHEDEESSIKTYYESQWLSRGKKIKLISFKPQKKTVFIEPEEKDIPKDNYRAYPRHTISPSVDL